MNFTQSFKLAIKSLLLSKMRALLTMLGIIIGVAAVIIITSLGNGMQNYMNAQFEQLGSNLIQVMVYGRGEGGTRDVSTEDMYALVEKYPQYLSGVTPYVSATAKVRQGTEDFDRTSIYGVSEAFYRADTQKTIGSFLRPGRSEMKIPTAESAARMKQPIELFIRSGVCPTAFATQAKAAVTSRMKIMSYILLKI